MQKPKSKNLGVSYFLNPILQHLWAVLPGKAKELLPRPEDLVFQDEID
jgi:hypothetical protein